MKRIYCYISLLIFAFAAVCAQVPEPESVAPGDIVALYDEWHDVEFSGKLSMEKLPVSPTVKIYMVRDSLIQISARVPLMGEIGRVTLTPGRLLLVNKYKKTYCEENAVNLMEMYPSAIADLQSLLLARVVIFGQGQLGPENAESVEVQEMDNGNYIIIPHTDAGVVPFNYGYVVSPSMRTLATLLNVAGKASLELQYAYKNRGMQIDALYDNMKGKKTRVQLDFNSVKWGGREMPPVKTGGYRKLGLKEFFQNLK